MLALRLGHLLLNALLPNCCPAVQTLIIVVITIISTCISRQRLGLGRCLEYQRLGLSRLGLWECCARQRLGRWGWHRLGLWGCCARQRLGLGWRSIDMHALDTCRQPPLFFFFFFFGGTLWCCGGGYASTRQRLAPTC